MCPPRHYRRGMQKGLVAKLSYRKRYLEDVYMVFTVHRIAEEQSKVQALVKRGVEPKKWMVDE